MLGNSVPPVFLNVSKTYPPRGPLQQYRLAESSLFKCSRCGEAKTSKLITVLNGDWNRKLCNSCYGRLLSVYEIKAGDAPDSDRTELLADVLLLIVGEDDRRQRESLLNASEERASLLCKESLRFVATAEHVAAGLEASPQLEWSPAVIGLCKAFEIELIRTLIDPLAVAVRNLDLKQDLADEHLRRIASYCAYPNRKPPELGSVGHFIQTIINSQSRRNTSVLTRTFLSVCKTWPNANWILSHDGLHAAVSTLAKDFRNPAAHTDELDASHYAACRRLLIGDDGKIWKLILATRRRQ